MPGLNRFYSIIVKMIYMDNVRHHEALVGIDGELLAGSIPAKQFKLVLA